MDCLPTFLPDSVLTLCFPPRNQSELSKKKLIRSCHCLAFKNSLLSFPIPLNENRNSSLWPLGPKWSGFCQPFQPLAPLPHLGFSHTGPCYSLNTSQGFCTCWPLCLKCYSPDCHKVGFLSSIRSGLTWAQMRLILPHLPSRNESMISSLRDVSSKAAALPKTPRL